MALSDIGRLITAFFRRPVSKNDLAELWKSLGARGSRPEHPEFDETRIYKRPDPLEGWHASSKSLEVHEEPLDTLPDELRDELLKHTRPPRP